MKNLTHVAMGAALMIQNFPLCGQSTEVADLHYMGMVNIYFYAEQHYTEPADSHTIYVSPGLLELKMAVQPLGIPTRALMRANGRPGGRPFSGLQVKIMGNGNIVRDWQPFCRHASVQACEAGLPDHSLVVGNDSVYGLSIRDSLSDNPVLSLAIIGRMPEPGLEGWREISQPDPLIERMPHLTKVIGSTPVDSLFKMPADQIRPANTPFIQFKMKPAPPWADSLWEYSWSPLDKPQPDEWRRGGRLLTLPYGDRQQWVLRIRSPGGTEHKAYKVQTQPPWYKRPAILVLGSLVLLLLAGLLYFWWKQYRINKVVASQSALTSLIMGMQSSLSPHIMMNALGALHGMIGERQWEQAQLYCTELATLLKYSLARQVKVYSLLEEELKEIRDYVYLQKVKIHFHYQERIENQDWAQQVELPTGLLLPLVENAVKHNLSAACEEQYLYLDLYAEGFNLCITIRALGRSMPEATPGQTPKTSAGYGIPWVNTRINLHNRMFPSEPILLRMKNSPQKSETFFEFTNKIQPK